MDAFKRATLLASQAAMGQVTSDEVRKAMETLIPAMQADPESQLATKKPADEEPAPDSPQKNW